MRLIRFIKNLWDTVITGETVFGTWCLLFLFFMFTGVITKTNWCIITAIWLLYGPLVLLAILGLGFILIELGKAIVRAWRDSK